MTKRIISSKTQAALRLMRRKWTSQLDTLREFGLLSLSQSVTKLKARGHLIVSRPVKGERYVQYRCLDA